MAKDLTKIGIAGNAPLDRDGRIAARLADPDIVADTGAVWLRLNFIEFYKWGMSEEGYPFKAFARKEVQP